MFSLLQLYCVFWTKIRKNYGTIYIGLMFFNKKNKKKPILDFLSVLFPISGVVLDDFTTKPVLVNVCVYLSGSDTFVS